MARDSVHFSMNVSDLCREYKMMREVDHKNIIKLLGFCNDGRGPFLLIMEYAEHGALRYLLKSDG